MNTQWKRLALVGSVAIGSVALSISFRGNADLVLDEQANEKQQADASDERETLRKVIRKTKAVETTQEIVADPVVVAGDREEGSMAPSMKSELVRRKRMREEMKNEDLLQQRLEELRLRDEEKRTKKVLKSTGMDEDSDDSESRKSEARKAAKRAQMDAEIEMQEEIVTAPANEPKMISPVYQMSPAPSNNRNSDQMRVAQSSSYSASAAPAATPAATSSSSSDSYGSAVQKSNVSISPRFGFASIGSKDFEFSPKFTAGLALGMDVSDNVAVEFGYTYSEVGVKYQNTSYSAYGNTYGSSDELSYKQNIFDANMKLYFLDRSSRVRPFVGAGMGYSMGYLNYSERVQRINQSYGVSSSDYELKSFIGQLSAGIDLKVSDNVSIGAFYRYMKPLSSSEGDSLNTGAFYSQNYDYTREYVRSSLKDASVSMFQLGASFQF